MNRLDMKYGNQTEFENESSLIEEINNAVSVKQLNKLRMAVVKNMNTLTLWQEKYWAIKSLAED